MLELERLAENRFVPENSELSRINVNTYYKFQLNCFFSALKTGFSASEIYVGIIHAGNLFDI